MFSFRRTAAYKIRTAAETRKEEEKVYIFAIKQIMLGGNRDSNATFAKSYTKLYLKMKKKKKLGNESQFSLNCECKIQYFTIAIICSDQQEM
jgi:hypothetical protein